MTTLPIKRLRWITCVLFVSVIFLKTVDHLWIATGRSFSGEKLSKVVYYNMMENQTNGIFIEVLKELARVNHFNMRGQYDTKSQLSNSQRELDLFINKLPYSDVRFENEQPVYINIIENPARRFLSSYFKHQRISFDDPHTIKKTLNDIDVCFSQGSGECQQYDNFMLLKHFCSRHEACPTSKKALIVSKRVVDDEYRFIGIAEELEDTLKIFEKILPNYFTNAVRVLKKVKAKKNFKEDFIFGSEIVEETKQILRYFLYDEIDLYNYLWQKFNDTKAVLEIN